MQKSTKLHRTTKTSKLLENSHLYLSTITTTTNASKNVNVVRDVTHDEIINRNAAMALKLYSRLVYYRFLPMSMCVLFIPSMLSSSVRNIIGFS